jgi:RNA polymerase sigma-70 factor (ECF subfamily)
MLRPKSGENNQRSLATEFEQVVRDSHERIFNFIFYMISDREEASDLTQETFVRAYAAFADFRGEATVNTWLCRIARNLTINRLRQRQVEKRLYWQPTSDEEGEYEDWEDIQALPGTTPVDYEAPNHLASLEAKELKKLVQDCLNELSPEFREVILLREMEGYSYLQMTEILGCSMEALKSRLFRARISLKQKLSPHLFPKGKG